MVIFGNPLVLRHTLTWNHENFPAKHFNGKAMLLNVNCVGGVADLNHIVKLIYFSDSLNKLVYDLKLLS